MIHSTSVFRRSFLYLCILGAFGLTSCTSCKQKNAGPLRPKVDPGPPGADGKQGADENKESDREAKEEETKLGLIFNDLTSTTAQGSSSTDRFNLALKNNGSKTIQLAKLKLGYTADLVRTYQGGHKTGDAHQDQFIIVRAGEDVDVDNMTLQELTGQAELAAGASVTINIEVKAGEAVDAATTQLKVMEASETRASQAFNFANKRTPVEDEHKEVPTSPKSNLSEGINNASTPLSREVEEDPAVGSKPASIAISEAENSAGYATGEIDNKPASISTSKASESTKISVSPCSTESSSEVDSEVVEETEVQAIEQNASKSGASGGSTIVSVLPCPTESSSEVVEEADRENTPPFDEIPGREEIMKRFLNNPDQEPLSPSKAQNR